jgi:hypothetical protein
MGPLGRWLAAHWVAGALFMGIGFTLLVPVIAGAMSTSVLLIYLHTPGYMLHQVEEHTGDRFRRFINTRVFGGREALTTNAVLWINLPGVWGLNLAALYAARMIEPALGLAAPYLMVVNAAGHVASSTRFHCYNPGLWSSLLVFFPLGLVTLWFVPASLAAHGLGLGMAVLIHALIAATTLRRAESVHQPGLK